MRRDGDEVSWCPPYTWDTLSLLLTLRYPSARLHPGGQLAEGAVCSEPALPGDAWRLGNRDSTASRARDRPETLSRLAGRGLGTLTHEGMDAPGIREPTCFSPPAPRKSTPHRVSWVEDPPKPEARHTGQGAHHPERQVYYPGPEARSLGPEVHFPSPALEEKEEVDKDGYKEEEEGCEAVLTAHIRALASTRSSYVARQCRCLRARLVSDSGNPCSPGDPATELLQDVRQLLTNLQNYLANDPDVRAVFGNRGPSIPREEDLGNGNWRETPQGFKGTMSWSCKCSHLISESPKLHRAITSLILLACSLPAKTSSLPPLGVLILSPQAPNPAYTL